MQGQPLEDAKFTIAANGYADGPAQALRDFLVERNARRVTTIWHPLTTDDAGVHAITTWERGTLVAQRRWQLPSHPPFTYPLDLLVPVHDGASQWWFGFNALACVRGLAARALRRADHVVYWCVDYVEKRFGGSALTNAYEWLDGFCCRHASARFELSTAALEARSRRHQRQPLAPAWVVPMGAWVDRVPATAPDAYARRTLVYLGHLVPRQGVDTLVRAVALLAQWGDAARADVIGRGPELEPLRRLADDLGIGGRITFHGFIEDHRQVERVLASGSIGVAPYEPDPDSFTRFADPGKLKAYLAAGLPVLVTDVPPNAAELAREGAAQIIAADPQALARAAQRLLDSADEWTRRREAALGAAQRFGWTAVLSEALTRLGLDCT